MRKNRSALSSLPAAAAAALSLVSLTTAHSAVVYSGAQNASPRVGPPLPVDLDGLGGPELSLSISTGSLYVPPYRQPGHLGGNGWGGGYHVTSYTVGMSLIPSVDFVGRIGPGGAGLTIMGVDSLIGPDSVFSPRDSIPLASSLSGSVALTDGFLGFRFNPTGDQTLYGWGRIMVDRSRPLNGAGFLTLVDWAYDDSGAPIRAGQVPEPSGAVLAGLAAVTAISRRRRPSRGATPSLSVISDARGKRGQKGRVATF